MSLEQSLREAARLGILHGVTLWPSGERWQANLRLADNRSWHVEHDDDPANALRKLFSETDAGEETGTKDVFS